MSCWLCGGKQDDVKIDHRDMKTAPCGTCEAAIQECLDGYPDLEDEGYAYIEPSPEEFGDITIIDRKYYD